MGYIYLLTNKINNKKYVGITTFLPFKRWTEHSKIETKEVSRNLSKIERAFKKYGFKNFIYEILEEANNEKLDELEKYYIALYDTYNNGYNSTLGGRDGEVKGKYGKEKVRSVIEYIKNHPGITFSEMSKIFNVPASWISDINCGEIFRFDNEVYPISDRSSHKNYSKEQIKQIYNELLQGKSLTKLSEELNVSRTTLSRINKGELYRQEGYKYPIQIKNIGNQNIKYNKLKEYVLLLLSKNENNYTYAKIDEIVLGDKTRKKASHINRGVYYSKITTQIMLDLGIENPKYPISENKI